ncbi:MAG TPA: hypothetical protein PLV42_11440 [bacterium]|nr:hypothetical protein [bacterium]
MRSLFLFLSVYLPVLMLTAYEDSTEAKLFHNDAWFIEQQYRQNHAEFERTIKEMKDLKANHGSAEFGVAQRLITELDRRVTRYNGIVQKLVLYYKQKWNQKHYQKMDQKWKDDTYKKHKAKLVAINTLMMDLQQAYNGWNDGRSGAVKKKNKELLAAFGIMNAALDEALKAGAVAEENVFKEMEAELSAIKNLK